MNYAGNLRCEYLMNTAADSSVLTASFEQNGFVLKSALLSVAHIEQLGKILLPLSQQHGARQVIARFPDLSALLQTTALPSLLEGLNLVSTALVRSLYFDKPLDHNWLVPWHQDRVVALREKVDLPGFKHWSWKDDFWHVEAPLELLQHLIIVRIALDDADQHNGALKVIPGSHQHGALNTSQIQDLVKQVPPYTCCTKAGDALVMKQLLVHSSAKNVTRASRRILHLEFCTTRYFAELNWAENVGFC